MLKRASPQSAERSTIPAAALFCTPEGRPRISSADAAVGEFADAYEVLVLFLKAPGGGLA
ncbi:hypothetical protein HMPREF1548_06368 [Clostridium sp. KLE 1755]|nr:hypothetical protein HMPREF1548_06368 [Clostridium sp. KLE 1755]